MLVRSYAYDVYTQIGIVTLIGLASKNAILIVEYARLRHESGLSIVKSALAAAQHWANDFERKKYLGELPHADAGQEVTCGEFVEMWIGLKTIDIELRDTLRGH